MRILIVDDDQDLLFIGQHMLRVAGYTTATLADCKKLFALLPVFAPDLIILDINLGDCNGIALCEQIKQSPDFQHMIVVLYSSDVHDQAICTSCNADYFIQKPFTRGSLLDYLSQHHL